MGFREQKHLDVSYRWLSLFPIILGVLKLYFHYYSSYRIDMLDYFVAAGAIVGGVFYLFGLHSNIVLITSAIFISIEMLKAAFDFHDLFDLLIVVLAIAFLSFPFLKLGKRRKK